MSLLSFSDISSNSIKEEIKEVFFECSSLKSFKTEKHRNDFFDRWTSCYFEQFPDYIWVWRENDKVQAYLMGCPETSKLSVPNPGQKTFSDCLTNYKAHLHVNCLESVRGKRVGTALVVTFINSIPRESLGLHIITSSDAANKKFYKKLKFEYEVEREDLLFMGRSLA